MGFILVLWLTEYQLRGLRQIIQLINTEINKYYMFLYYIFNSENVLNLICNQSFGSGTDSWLNVGFTQRMKSPKHKGEVTYKKVVRMATKAEREEEKRPKCPKMNSTISYM